MYKPISEKFLDNNYLFALEFRQGYIFGRVLRREPMIYEPYDRLNDIAATSYQDRVRIQDADKKDILYMDEATPPRLLHGAIGIKPHFIRQYISYPEGEKRIGEWPNLKPVSVSSGDNFAYQSGKHSPYDNPTDFMELWIPPLIHLDFAHYNPDDRAHKPILNLQFRLYYIQIFKPGEDYDEIIKKIAQRRIPAAFGYCGTASNLLDFSGKLADAWKVTPITIDEALRL